MTSCSERECVRDRTLDPEFYKQTNKYTVNTLIYIFVYFSLFMASKGVGEVKLVFQTPHDLFNHLQSASNLILVDSRPSEEFSLSSVRTSLNLDFGGKEDSESLKLIKGRFALRKYFNVFLYDDCDYLECGDKKGTAWDLLQLLIQEGACRSPVYILETGFSSFVKTYPYLVRGNSLSVVAIFPAEIIHGKLYLGEYITFQCNRCVTMFLCRRFGRQ